MSAKVCDGIKSLPNNSAIGPYLRVKMSGGFVALAGAADAEIGLTEQRTQAADTEAPIRLLSGEKTLRMTASGAITQYAEIYRGASGKITATPNGSAIGLSLDSASGDGSIVEVLFYH